MSLTPDGAGLTASALATALTGARVEVADGEQSAVAAAVVEPDGAGVRVTAVFDEGEAVFDWRRRDVVLADGTIVDRQDGDFGRKPAGARWTVDVDLQVKAEA